MRIIACLLFVSFLTPLAYGQYVKIGSGTAESSSYNSSPVNIYYRRTVAQFIYTAQELTDAGVSPNTPINEIGFYVTEAPVYSLPGYRVQVKNTTQNNVATALPNGGWSTIVNSFTYTPTAGGFDMIPTNGNFTWDGVSNIAVQVCWSRVNPSWNASGRVRIMPQTNGYIYRWTDNNGNSCGNTPNTVSSSKPQIQFRHHNTDTTTWIGNISDDWFNPGNWSHDVPSKFMTAYIPTGTLNTPLISGGNGVCNNFHVESGAAISFSGSERLTVHGDWTNYGILNAATSTIVLEGSSQSVELNGSVTQNIFNLEVNSLHGTSIVSGTYRIQGSFYLNGASFQTNDSLALLSNATGTARIAEIRGTCDYTLEMFDSFGDGWNEGFLEVWIDGNVAHTFVCSGASSTQVFSVNGGGNISLVYHAGFFENENSYALYDPDANLIFSDGPSPNTGTVYTTNSNCGFNYPLQGDIYSERYIDAGSTHWRFLTFPVSGQDLEKFDDDFITSGIPGSDYPLWPTPTDPWESFFFYEENMGITFDEGYVAPSSMSDILGVGQGVWVWCGDTITGTQPFTIDVRGPANTGDINLPVSFNVASGNMDDDGWNMVANPYPCTIDWDAGGWTKNNVENAIYIWNPDLQQYATYIAGVGLNGGSNRVASWQAFMVHADAANPILTVAESCKVDSDQGFLKANNVTDILKMKISNSNSSDEIAFRFDGSFSNGFDYNADARKAKKSLAQEIFWYSRMQGIDYSINSLKTPQGSMSIPIYVEMTNNDSVSLQINQKSGIMPFYCVKLQDLKTGNFIDIKVDTLYHFHHTLFDNGHRFNLIIGHDPEIEVSHNLCFGDTLGSIELLNPSDYLSTIWMDNQNFMGSGTLMTNLNAGTYHLITNAAYCGIDTVTVVVEEGQDLSQLVLLEDATCFTCCDGSVSWQNNLTAYVDGVQMGGNNAALCPGWHHITLEDENGCSYENDYFIGTVNGLEEPSIDFSIYPNPSSGILVVKSDRVMDRVNLFDLGGKRLYTATPNQYELALNFLHLSEGMYLLEVKTAEGSSFQKIQIER